MLKGIMFTSLDITNQAKKSGLRIRNYQVADWMRRNVIAIAHDQGSMYNQQLITVDSKAAGMTLAYLYLPNWESSSNYLDRDQNPKSYNTKPNNKKSKISKRDAGVKSQTIKAGSTGDFWKTQKRDAKGRWI